MSLSARRAWIEMLVPELHSDGISSLSARRAWIEISANALPITSPTVALRKESVDRNIIFNTCRAEPIQSLSARRAWIEINMSCNVVKRSAVALRKESVDRNRCNRCAGRQ